MSRSIRCEPVLSADGVFYGSPVCCGSTFCRKDWYDHAVSAADELADRMGSGWVPRVWENLGWHYTVSKGVAVISPNWRGTELIEGKYPVTSYTARLNTSKVFMADAETPEDALGFAVQDARTFAIRVETELAELNDDANG